MKDPKIIILLILLSFTAIGLQAQTVEMRALKPFNKITTGGSWDVILKKGEKEEVKLESDKLDLERVITEVENNSLNIHLEKGNYRNINLTVYVTYRELEEIRSSGSGNLKSNSDLNAGDLEIQLSGSGNASFKNINADNLYIGMSGSGNVHISGGSVGNLTVKQSGSGNFNGLDCFSEEAEIHKSGSGNTALGVNENLSVRSSGSGNVQYRGNPQNNDIKFSGSGRLVKK